MLDEPLHSRNSKNIILGARKIMLKNPRRRSHKDSSPCSIKLQLFQRLRSGVLFKLFQHWHYIPYAWITKTLFLSFFRSDSSFSQSHLVLLYIHLFDMLQIGELAASFMWDPVFPVKRDQTLFHVLLLLSKHRPSVVPVTQHSSSKVVGFVTEVTILT